MKAYSEYKDSGVQWIGKVPSHWNPCRFKNFISLINTPSKDDNKIGLENIESGTGHFKETDSEFEGNGVQFVEDDIVYGKLRPYLRKVWLATNKGNAVGDFFVFRANKSNPSYIHWLMLSDGFTSEANGSTYGAKMPRVSSDFILSMRYVLPPFPEQQVIASFLDAKTKPIDDIIAKREKQIELLEEMKSAIISLAVTKGLNPEAKMKDSGIEWIGEVPEHWEVADLKRYAKISTGKTPSTKKDEYFENEEIVWFTPGDFPDGSIILNDSSRKIDKRAIKASEAFLYPKNSVFLVGIGGTLGKIGIFEEEASCNQQINVIVCKSDVLKKYVAYYLYSKKELLKVYSNAATLPILNQDKTGYIKIALPPLSEQQDIAFYLDTETSKIDTRIAKRRKQIELLQEYKQALITAAVTGKIDVREFNS